MSSEIQETITKLFRRGKGILAVDESEKTLEKRFKQHNIPITGETRLKYRELLFTTDNLNKYISGVILHEDTFSNQKIGDVFVRDVLNKANILVGVKVDEGLVKFKNTEFEYTQGKENLLKKCIQCKAMGANFLKWRCVIPVTHKLNEEFLNTILDDLSYYATVAIKNNLVPILEPEVLHTGSHSAEEQKEVLSKVITLLKEKLYKNSVSPNMCVLKTSFAMSGQDGEDDLPEEVAFNTQEILNSKALDFAGIVFLSGGLTAENAFEYLGAVYKQVPKPNLPISFSFGRALQELAWKEWDGTNETIGMAQKGLIKLIRKNAKLIV